MRSFFNLLAVCALMAGFYYIRYYSDRRMVMRDSAVFVTDAVNDIALHWNTKQFAAYADPGINNGRDMESMFRSYRTLGNLVGRINCEIQDYNNYTYPNTKLMYIGSSYKCDARFEKSPATILVTLYRFSNSNIWKFRSFDMYSSYLNQPPPQIALPVNASTR